MSFKRAVSALLCDLLTRAGTSPCSFLGDLFACAAITSETRYNLLITLAASSTSSFLCLSLCAGCCQG
jgi:hypothetical protein